MYDWFKVLDVFRLSGETQSEDIQVKDWHELSMRFIAEIQIMRGAQEPVIIAVDCFPLLLEFINASIAITPHQTIDIYLGEGWEMKILPTQRKHMFQIGLGLSEGAAPQVSKMLSTHETALFISVKTSEIISYLKPLGLDPEYYIPRFMPA